MSETLSKQMNSCDICGIVYTNLNGLKTHILRKHNTTYAILQAKKENVDLLKCVVCGFESNNLNKHVLTSHGMRPVEYKEKFPGAETMRLSPKQIAKMSATKMLVGSKHQDDVKESLRRKQETLDSGLQVLTCRICGQTSANSLISHITRKHKIEMDLYRSQYPESRVQQLSPSQRKTISSVMKEKLNDPVEREAFLQWRSFPSEIKHWIKKGYDPREAQEKVSEFQKVQSLKGNNELTRAKRSEKNSGSSNPMSLESIANRENITLAEAHALTPCYGRTGDKHPMFGKKHTDEALKKIGDHLNHTGRSKIEHEMSDMLIEKYGGEKNVGVYGWCVDYLNKDRKLIVEFFGDYWHHNPKKYLKDFVNGITKRSSQQTWEHDARKLKELRDQGYEVIVIWESDWRFDKETCLKRIKDAYDRIL